MLDRSALVQSRDDAKAALYRFLDGSLSCSANPAELDRYLRLRHAFDAAQRKLDKLPGGAELGVSAGQGGAQTDVGGCVESARPRPAATQ